MHNVYYHSTTIYIRTVQNIIDRWYQTTSL